MPAVPTLSEQELRDALAGRTAQAEPLEALGELIRRGAASAPLLATTLLDPATPAAARAGSAIALGRYAAPEAQGALVRALGDVDPTVLRRAADALGKVGDAGALPALRRLAPADRAAARSVGFARSLIAYRLGLAEEIIARPARSAEIAPGEGARTLPVRAPAPAEAALLTQGVRRELPAVPLVPAAAIRFDCGRHAYAIVPARDLGRVGDRSAVIGAVFERSEVNDDYFLSEYLLANPAAAGQVDLIGVRPSGVLLHAGEIDPASGRVRLGALPQRSFPPIAAEGRIDRASGRLSITKLLAEADFNLRGAQPRHPAPVA